MGLDPLLGGCEAKVGGRKEASKNCGASQSVKGGGMVRE